MLHAHMRLAGLAKQQQHAAARALSLLHPALSALCKGLGAHPKVLSCRSSGQSSSPAMWHVGTATAGSLRPRPEPRRPHIRFVGRHVPTNAV